ncbi:MULTISPECIES: 5'-methylthioadenosine/adenosylhomocysteine nucleosidase [Cetobacterium]|jgi:adenosylhomocysteine nucleosidase|uniref:adenosylhomocysteine nucleosidase n=1 Tax=Candidatus Cetobacterium colombiensis TaxID=3073100 RepID=A0ABU4W8C9_9FUSO|nr:5'-methylthioadenosine/adenosylhomocysteine nucleosidase [Candidatus Cetobacterium colombiensis]MDX8335778.1 5'-methylthioadenosine/adenosylhomocysteine nucleosidase [Candidatus Cetobacterium colombiensis]
MLLGIIGAMNEEVVQLKEVMNLVETKELGGYQFFKGTLFNREIILVECGIGKVNAAICSTLLIQEFKVDKVLFTGVAGGLNPEINIGDIVISTDLVEHDFDCTAFGYDHGVIPRMENSKFKADDELVVLAKKVAEENFGKERVFVGTIVSGDVFVASNEKINWLRETFTGECTEMEGAAVAHVCSVMKKPFVIIRSISDKANHDANMNFDEFVKLAAQNSKIIIEGILKAI